MNSDPSNKRLSEELNYKPSISIDELDNSIISISKILTTFLKYISEDIVVKDVKQFLFIVENGINTILNIFKVLLISTKNIELTLYHIEKACIYYIEFISQIGEEGQSYIGLNIRDAIIFVFKKTIYDINKSYIKKDDNEKIYNILNASIEITKEFILLTVKNKNIQEIKSLISDFLEININMISKKILFKNTTNLDCRLAKNNLLLSLVSKLRVVNCDYINTLNIIICLIKKINKKENYVYPTISIDLINKFTDYDNNISIHKFINMMGI